ncbi:hypothetical protein OKW45_007579 [Paraburkholderia sp. WSM4175]
MHTSTVGSSATRANRRHLRLSFRTGSLALADSAREQPTAVSLPRSCQSKAPIQPRSHPPRPQSDRTNRHSGETFRPHRNTPRFPPLGLVGRLPAGSCASSLARGSGQASYNLNTKGQSPRRTQWPKCARKRPVVGHSPEKERISLEFILRSTMRRPRHGRSNRRLVTRCRGRRWYVFLAIAFVRFRVGHPVSVGRIQSHPVLSASMRSLTSEQQRGLR